MAISVGSLSTQGLFRPLPPITWLIGNHLSHTWMGSSHEEVRPPAGGNKTLLRRLPLSPPLYPFSSYNTNHKQQELYILPKLQASILHCLSFTRLSNTCISDLKNIILISSSIFLNAGHSPLFLSLQFLPEGQHSQNIQLNKICLRENWSGQHIHLVCKISSAQDPGARSCSLRPQLPRANSPIKGSP